MTTTFRFILLLIHVAISAISVYYIGDLMSQQLDMFSVLALGLLLSLIMISIINHTKNFLLFIKNKTKQL